MSNPAVAAAATRVSCEGIGQEAGVSRMAVRLLVSSAAAVRVSCVGIDKVGVSRTTSLLISAAAARELLA